jgi:aryl-alcohol dehydrogenase-like predicted oxidoreductase
MDTRMLGPSGLEISRIGVGTAPIGSVPGHWWVNWGHQDERDSVAAIHAAADAGVNWVDTAPFYGWGRAEEVVGRALAGRDDVLVFTKCGTFRRDDGEDFMDLSPDAVRRDVEQSLRRLGRDHVDLLQPHDVDRGTPIEETWSELMRLVDEGKVRHCGISNHPVEAVERALEVGPVAALQYQYSLLHRDPERDILPLASSRGIGVLAWGPLASGFLADGFDVGALDPDDFRRRHPFVELDLSPLHRALQAIGKRRGRTGA